MSSLTSLKAVKAKFPSVLPHKKLFSLRLLAYGLLLLLILLYLLLQLGLSPNGKKSFFLLRGHRPFQALTHHLTSTFHYLIYDVQPQNDNTSSAPPEVNYQLGLIWTTYFGNGYIEEDRHMYHQISLEELVSKNQSNASSSSLPAKLLKDLENLNKTHNLGTSYLYQPKLCATQFPRCFFTDNRALARLAGTIVFHWSDLKAEDLPEEPDEAPESSHPQKRPLWILYNLEPPWLSIQLPEFELPNSNDQHDQPITFDLVANYRSDASIVLPYGRVVPKRKTQRKRKTQIPKKSTKFSANNPISATQNTSEDKRKQAVWFVSNCETASRREEYVRQLMEDAGEVEGGSGGSGRISVDIFGACGPPNQTAACLPKHSIKCYREIERQYRFYLSFENAVCRDYVTEKLFNALNYHLLPVVLGGANYSSLLPPHSYLDATKLTPKALASKLRQLTSDPELYESYFWWKDHYEVVSEDDVPHNLRLACRLCELMEEKERNEDKQKEKVDKRRNIRKKSWKIASRFTPLPSPITAQTSIGGTLMRPAAGMRQYRCSSIFNF